MNGLNSYAGRLEQTNPTVLVAAGRTNEANAATQKETKKRTQNENGSHSAIAQQSTMLLQDAAV